MIAISFFWRPHYFQAAGARLFSILVAGGVLLGVSGCQGLTGAWGGRGLSSVERAERAWQAVQRARPGTVAAKTALHEYNEAVVGVIQSLRETEGTAEWGRPMVIDGARPWRLAFDPPARRGSARTLAVADFAQCVVAADVKVRGFDRVVARGGLGVPVVLVQDDPVRAIRPFHPPKGDYLPATAVLEFPEAGSGGAAEARLRFYNPLAVSAVEAGPRSLALAENLTAPLQFSLTDSTLDENGPDRLASSASGEDESKLFFPLLYDPGKTPVVFVHGLRSGPVVWKNAVNELFADPELRRRYQPVCFVYPSGLPIPISAARLRQLLQASRNTLDPGHRHAGFDRMVLVGHSMGGLVARMQVIDSGRDFWRAFFTASPNALASEIDPATRKMVRGALMFDRLPNVKTVVFITTPHRGSEIADLGIVQSVAQLLLAVPKSARKRFKALTDLPPAVIHPALRSFSDWGNNGVENLSTKHPYFEALAKRPMATSFHSIIGVKDAGHPADGTDGVVPYRSAHLKGAATETVVPYPHGCVERSGTVGALLKILKGER
jgi:triacylglycerol esterase/lipase EstA (alpha/beta hydrolase family)